MYNKIINDLKCLGFFLLLPERYPADKKALMYPSGSADLEQVKWGGWENGTVITVEGRLWAHLSLVAAVLCLHFLVEIPGQWKMMERAWRTTFWSSGVMGSSHSPSLCCLQLKSSLSLTVILVHSGAVCLPKLAAVVSWERGSSINRIKFTCLAFHIRKRSLCGIFLDQFLMSH